MLRITTTPDEEIVITHYQGTRRVNGTDFSISDEARGYDTFGPWTVATGICNGIANAGRTVQGLDAALAAIDAREIVLEKPVNATLIHGITHQELEHCTLAQGARVQLLSVRPGVAGPIISFYEVTESGARYVYETGTGDF